jgi:hypothetical protein
MTIAQRAPEPTTEREERWRAIRERTTRGLLTYNAGNVLHLEGDVWAVRSTTRGGYHRVDLAGESCTCEDWTHFGSERGIPCRHVYAVAIAHATRRSRATATLRELEARYRHELMDDHERQELRDRIKRLRAFR